MSDAVFRLRSQPAVSRAVVAMLIRHGADVNLGSRPGLTPLHIASIFGCCEVIPVLLAAGADLNAIYNRPSDNEEWFTPETPLESAIGFARFRAYPLLLRAGAALPDDDDRDFWTNPDREDCRYLQRVADAGGWEAYRRAHVDKLALLFTPKPETGRGRRSKRRRSPIHGLPPELVRRVVEYWAHAGYY